MTQVVINEKTKKNVKDFISEIDAIRDKIKSANCSLQDYNNLEKYLVVGGFSEIEISQIYKQCGFDSWNDYHNKKTSLFGYHDQFSLECVIAKIDGIVDGIAFSLSHAIAGK